MIQQAGRSPGTAGNVWVAIPITGRGIVSS
jgi:hypothetical protein